MFSYTKTVDSVVGTLVTAMHNLEAVSEEQETLSTKRQYEADTAREEFARAERIRLKLKELLS